MVIERKETDESESLERLVERFRNAEKRALVKRGIEMWTRTERLVAQTPVTVGPKLN